jgi:hypothetical protein
MQKAGDSGMDVELEADSALPVVSLRRMQPVGPCRRRLRRRQCSYHRSSRDRLEHTGHLKVASFLRSERMTKWNEGLRIKEQLGAAANFSGGSALPLLNRV